MDYKASVFKRGSRLKKQRLNDGSIKEITVKGGWVYRIKYVDDDGKPCVVERGVYSHKGKAQDALNTQLGKLQKTHGRILKAERMTFDDLVDRCEAEFYKPAVVIGGERVAGIRSAGSVKGMLKNLRAYFGNRKLESITTDSLTKYKIHRRSQYRPTKEGEPKIHISIATINRELAVMRKMMRYAHREGWTVRDIFYNAKVIETAKEVERQRILSRDEEQRLLAACCGRFEVPYKRNWKGKEQELTATFEIDNRHLRAMLVLALDSGMRRGEIFKMRWTDIDFENGVIRIIGTHTKTERERVAPLSSRAKAELQALRLLSGEDRPFPYTDIKRSFATAKRLAGISDLRFHDLRRTAITRWIAQGTSLAFAGKFAGHSQLQTTMKHYTATDTMAIQQLNQRIDAYSSAQIESDVIENERVQ